MRLCELSERDRAMLAGELGAANAMAMRVLSQSAVVAGAQRLVDVVSAHIDGCLYHGQASLDFVERLVEGGGKVAIPSTLNVGSLDLIHPELFRGDDAAAAAGKRLMEAHLELGCQPSFTCAPYQRQDRPKFGQQIAWGESNAIVFANSVLGARTNRYGDFLDLCAALTGRAPYAGLHVPENRRGEVLLDVGDLDWDHPDRDILFALLGLFVGMHAGGLVPVIVGLPSDATEDELKALGAASASSGSVALFHAVGITPEAPDLATALGGRQATRQIRISDGDLIAIRRKLNAARPGEALVAVSLGTPHFSLREFHELAALFDANPDPLATDFYVNTSRYILWELEHAGLASRFAGHGVQIVVDTCTYITPVMRNVNGVVMTNSGKWAYYAPANIGARVAFGSMRECIRSAIDGRVWFDESHRR